ncbi:2-hexaprenyl-6-methoxy-1,4-benzoquinone methyltransferase [Fusarium falciforme]|nr:2-hexaprenyl-6-methoxy-1,4-benzoquinone methyltransferase [Fusarium falciforme]
MASRTALRSFSRSFKPSICSVCLVCPFSTTNVVHNVTDSKSTSTADRPTHFGFKTVTGGEQDRVAGVFSRVAEFYDKMSDLRSLGIHRLWKEYFISSLNPGATNPPGQPQRILDVVGGTGDIAFRHPQHSHEFNGNPSVHATI